MKEIRNVGIAVLASLVLIGLGELAARAVVIEGFTDTGNYLSVGVTPLNQLKVALTGVTLTSAAAHMTFTQIAGPGGVATLTLPTNVSRLGSLVCNFGDVDVWIGSATVTAAGPGNLLRGGNDACFSPDTSPSVYTGALFSNATGAYTLQTAQLNP